VNGFVEKSCVQPLEAVLDMHPISLSLAFGEYKQDFIQYECDRTKRDQETDSILFNERVVMIKLCCRYCISVFLFPFRDFDQRRIDIYLLLMSKLKSNRIDISHKNNTYITLKTKCRKEKRQQTI
jgi:hypothetical protein